METVNHLTTAASRAIWGESSNSAAENTRNETAGQEPLSGQLGNVAAGEPYDKGNIEPPIAEKSMSPTSEDTSLSNSGPNSTTGIAGIDSISSTSQPNTSAVSTADSMHGNTASTGQIGSVYGADQAGATNLHDPTSDTAFDKPIASNDIHGRTDAPSGVAEPTSDAQQTLNDRLDELRGSEKQDRIQETTREAENTTGASTKKGPGPDPKSLEEKLREAGGTSGPGAGGNNGPQKQGYGEGAGEQYVKGPGTKGEGGYFDVPQASERKEVERLRDQKGMNHHTGPEESKPSDTGTSSSSKAGQEEKAAKTSLKEKIKAKLHIDKH